MVSIVGLPLLRNSHAVLVSGSKPALHQPQTPVKSPEPLLKDPNMNAKYWGSSLVTPTTEVGGRFRLQGEIGSGSYSAAGPDSV